MVDPGGSIPRPDPTILTTEQLHREVGALEKRLEGRFDSIEEKFDIFDRWRIEQKDDSAKMVAAALTAQKELIGLQTAASERAIAKNESSITKVIDQLSATFRSGQDSLRRSLEDLKERVNSLDTRVTSVEQQKVGAREDRTGLYATLGAFALLITLGIAIAGFVMSRGGP